MSQRTIIVIPNAVDLADRKFLDNFLWRLRDALEREHLDAAIHVTAPHDPENTAAPRVPRDFNRPKVTR